ncbi:unnamed protein product [Prunus armeniaca]
MYFTESTLDDGSISDEDSRDSEYSEDLVNIELRYLHHSLAAPFNQITISWEDYSRGKRLVVFTMYITMKKIHLRLLFDDTNEDDEKGEGSTEEGASSTVQGSTRDEALTNSIKGSTEDDEKGECSTEEGAGSTVEGSTRDEPLTNSTKGLNRSCSERLNKDGGGRLNRGSGGMLNIVCMRIQLVHDPALSYQPKPKTTQYGSKQPCKLCSNTFYSDATLQSHIKDKHSSKLEDVQKC